MNSRLAFSVIRTSTVCAIALSCVLGVARAQSATWVHQAPIPTGYDITAVQMLSTSEIWAACPPDLLVHTTDGGEHWQKTTLATTSLWSLFFLDAQHGWAAGNGFFHTTNGGQSWVQDSDWGTIYELFFLDAHHGWACGNGGVTYRTLDGGLHWAYAAVGPIATLSSVYFVDASHGWTLSIDGEIYKTSDGGQNWTLQWSGANAYLSTLQFFDTQEGWAIGGNTFLHTTNAGQSWIDVPVPPGTWSHGANFSDRMHGVSVGEYGNITQTLDGGASWTTIQPIGVGPRLWDVHFADALHGTYSGEKGMLRSTIDGGVTWTALASGGSGETHALDAVDGLHAWAANDGGEVLYTTDGGALWQRSFVPGFDTYGHLQDVDFADTLHGWAVGRQEYFNFGVGRIAHSNDGGLTWEIQFSADEAYFDSVKAIDAQTAFAFGYVPSPFAQAYWMRTTDGGQHWTNLATSVSSGTSVDFIDANTGWMVGGNVIQKSIDGGQNWTPQYSAAQTLNAISFADAQHGWAVGWSGLVVHTLDGGAHWTSQNANVSAVLFGVQALSASTAWISGGNAYVARTTNGGSTWQPETLAGADPAWPIEGLAFVDAERGWVGGPGIWRRIVPASCPTPLAYCTGKMNSAGGIASIGWSGTPSVILGEFALTVANALPLKLGLFFYGTTGQAAIPFNNGTLCVAPPLVRYPPLHLDATGSASQSVTVSATMVASTRWFQFWYRDPAQTDATNIALSNGLEVRFCE